LERGYHVRNSKILGKATQHANAAKYARVREGMRFQDSKFGTRATLLADMLTRASILCAASGALKR